MRIGNPVNMEGKVIGLNRAVLRGFGGSNFAVLIRFGVALLKGMPARR